MTKRCNKCKYNFLKDTYLSEILLPSDLLYYGIAVVAAGTAGIR